LKAHIAANYLVYKNLEPPFLCLIASGGHSNIIKVLNYTEFELIGRTHDDAAGEALDKAARAMGLPYPGGIFLDKIAEKGDPLAFSLPRPAINNAPYDFSFSGLKTSIINIINNLKQKNLKFPVEDLAASFRHAVIDCLVTRFILAAENTNCKNLAICGGVAANSLLRKRLLKECIKRNFNFFCPPEELCGDNAAMVGSQAYYEYLLGNFSGLDLNAACTSDF
jgi:N6-L-threonylcarbamoyladenine synthase